MSVATFWVTGIVPIDDRETKPSWVAGHTPEKYWRTEAVELGDRRVDDEEDGGETDVDGDDEPQQRTHRRPAVRVDGVADEAERADRGDPHDPPHDLLDDGQCRLGELEERLSGLADLDGGDAEGTGDDDELEDVEVDLGDERPGVTGRRRDLEAEEVDRDESGEEPDPAPSCSGAWPCRELASAWTPGRMMRAMSRPMTTAMKAVSANHSGVETARRAALVTFLRLPMLAMIAVMMSGTTAALRRVTYEDPMVSRVCPSQLSWASLTGPHERATSPRTTPATRAIVTCTPKDFDHAGSLICFLSTAVPRCADALGEVRLLAQLLSNLSNSAN